MVNKVFHKMKTRMCEFHAKASKFIARLVVHHRMFVCARVKLCAGRWTINTV